MDIKQPVPEGFSPAGFTLPVPFLDLIGPTYQKVVDNGVDIGAWVTEDRRNGGQMAHGGFLMTLGDLATGLAANLVLGNERFPVHINFSVDFFSTAPFGSWVEARARIERQGKSMIFSTCDYYVGEEKIGHASSILKASQFKPSK